MLDKNGFDLWADGYDKVVGLSDEDNRYPFAGYKDVLGNIFARVTEKSPCRVLDLGFGTGVLTARLYEAGCEIFGQDFSPNMISKAKAKMPGASLFCGDFSKGLADEITANRFDAIVATYSLHHIPDADKPLFIRGLYALLNCGGTLLIGDVAFRTRAELEKCRAEAGDEWDDEEYYFVFDELESLLPGLGFKKISHCAGILSLRRD